MVLFISLTTTLHALVFFYDEYILHKKRVLSQKEVNSGLIDGLLFLSTVAMTLFTTYTKQLGYLYIALGFLSCLAILKHELFLPSDISPKERLVHAILYVLHPLILYAFYTSWKMNFFATNLTYWMLQLGYFALGFKAISYHVIYWNYIYERNPKNRKKIVLKNESSNPRR